MTGDPNLVHRIVGHKAITFDDGKFVMMGVVGMPFPISTVILFHKLASEQNPEKARDLLYHVGKCQCYAAISFNRQMHGYVKTKENVEMIRQQVALIGAGHLEVHKMDATQRLAIFKNKNIPFPAYYRKICGVQREPVDHFITGICAGMFEEIVHDELGIKEDMVAVETSCIAKGDTCCVIEVRPRGAWADTKHASQLPTAGYDVDEMKNILNVKNLL